MAAAALDADAVQAFPQYLQTRHSPAELASQGDITAIY
jgi:hypothetical protein